MICLNCKKQIPDDSGRCPHCGTEVFHKEQLVREIGFRRYQRWIFYGLFALAFLGAVGVVVKIYNVNSQLLLEVSNVKGSLSQREADLAKSKEDLSGLLKAKADLESQNKKVSADLTAKIAEAEKAVEENASLQSRGDQDRVRLEFFDSLLQNADRAAINIDQADLNRLPLADIAYAGLDADGDGLPDSLEDLFGTSASSSDTDGDSYSDREEIIGGFDPLAVDGKLPIDPVFAAKQAGKILKQENGYLWYVGFDAKRYFFGRVE
jgi:uncharacterized protein YpmS